MTEKTVYLSLGSNVGDRAKNLLAAIAALEILQQEPERVARVNARAKLFLELARDGGVDVGGSIGAAIIPVITGSSIRAGRLAEAMFQRGVNVQPILYPAVAERAARLRFFITADHSEEQIRDSVRILLEENRRVEAEKVDIVAVGRHLSRLSAAR